MNLVQIDNAIVTAARGHVTGDDVQSASLALVALVAAMGNDVSARAAELRRIRDAASAAYWGNLHTEYSANCAALNLSR